MTRPNAIKAWRGHSYTKLSKKLRWEKHADYWHSHLKKIKFAEDIVTAVATAVDKDSLKTVVGLASVHDQR
jgi:hypothetical protein